MAGLERGAFRLNRVRAAPCLILSCAGKISQTKGKLMANKQARILIIGGGFGGLFTALDLAGSGEVTLVSPEDHFLFTPMLYEYLSGEVEAWHIAPYYKELLDESVHLIRGEVTEIDMA